MTYQETIDYLYSCLPMYQRVGAPALKHDLNNTIQLCAHLGNPHLSFKSIHIAGTNGKGSSSHTIAAILQSAGYKTGLYTSPHLKNFTERIKINGIEIDQSAVVDFVARNKDVIDRVQPSFFEMTVAMALDHFARNEVDLAVIEVGLGGRLDSTNIITPLLSLITNISADHQDLLGDSLGQIAIEKAGIIKPGVPVIIGEYQQEIEEVFIQAAAERNAKITIASNEYQVKDAGTLGEYRSVDVFKNNQWHYKALKLGLGGAYQLKNVPGIIQAIEIIINQGFSINEQHIRNGFKNIKPLTGIKGRWQVLGEKPLIICDTGHNESGMSYIMEQLAAMNYRQLHIVFGMVKDKKRDKILALLPLKANYYFCQANIPRAMDAGLLLAQAQAFGLDGLAIRDVNEAIAAAKENAGEDDLIFIGGSSFVVAEINEL